MMENHTIQFTGLSKREYFAGLAMQGLLSKMGDSERIANESSEFLKNQIAYASKVMADTLLKQLES